MLRNTIAYTILLLLELPVSSVKTFLSIPFLMPYYMWQGQPLHHTVLCPHYAMAVSQGCEERALLPNLLYLYVSSLEFQTPPCQ